jgi:hypothetical protein
MGRFGTMARWKGLEKYYLNFWRPEILNVKSRYGGVKEFLNENGYF